MHHGDRPGDSREREPNDKTQRAELRRRGLGELVLADLNRDGVVDQWDIVAFMNGARPVRVVKAVLLPAEPSP